MKQDFRIRVDFNCSKIVKSTGTHDTGAIGADKTQRKIHQSRRARFTGPRGVVGGDDFSRALVNARDG